jgi:hypothetical protein
MRVADSLLTWSFTSEADENAKIAAELTRGRLVIAVAENVVWDFSWTWIELLEWLAENWKVLTAEHETPASDSEEDESSWSFLQEHSLGSAVQGAVTPLLIIWRDGDTGRIDAGPGYGRAPWQPIEDSLWTLGEHIASYLNDDDERGAIALRNWEAVAGRS